MSIMLITGAPTMLSQQNWTKFPIHTINKESHDTLRIRLRLPNNSDYFGLPVASCVTFRGYDVNNPQNELIRPYTPVSDSALQGFVEFVIKVYADKKEPSMTQYIASLTENDGIEMMGPWNKIEYPFEEKTNLAMICGGSGITPMIQVLKEMALHKDMDTRGVTLINANKTENDRLCMSDLLSIKTIMQDRLHVWDVIEQPISNQISMSSWNPNVIKIGRIDKQLLKEYLPEPSDETLIMICGTDGMLEALCGGKEPQEGGPPAQGKIGGFLKELNYTEDMVFKF